MKNVLCKEFFFFSGKGRRVTSAGDSVPKKIQNFEEEKKNAKKQDMKEDMISNVFHSPPTVGKTEQFCVLSHCYLTVLSCHLNLFFPLFDLSNSASDFSWRP